MILETLVSTCDAAERPNLAPMGPIVDDDWECQPGNIPQFTLRPFDGSTTSANLRTTGRAVIHFSSDAGLFADAVMNRLSADRLAELLMPTRRGFPPRMIRCERYFVVELVDRDAPVDEIGRRRLRCRVVESDVVDPPRPLNRAAAAVIEAAILSTRLHLLSADHVREEIERLSVAVDKTGGVMTTAAFERLRIYVDQSINASETFTSETR